MSTISSVCAAAVAQGELAALKVAEKLVPFLRGDGAVFLDRPQSPAPGDERSMCLDGISRVDRGVSHRRPDVVVPSNDLGDVGRQPVEDGVRDGNSAEVMGLEDDARAVHQASLIS
ncbi:hypothetical protein AB0D27_43135 [Streptomyces sp. NPDC048415]|uniref:hypothetical protein n=1 Tax=Streptomyces sp. NPDC048415 TaxID=3154822 RepID=UPI0034476C3B